MTIHHHPSDPTLMSYAAGSTGESLSFVIATHLSLCPSCRAKVSQMENVGGHELNTIMPVQMSSDALDSVMAMLDDSFFVEKPAPANDKSSKTLPYPLCDYMDGDLTTVPWKNLAPGVKIYDIPDISQSGGTLRLLNIAPGITIPEHSHNGSELTLVLQGSFSDELGRFKAGDMSDVDDDISHQPIADTNEPCICLIATEGPLKFKKLLPRLVQYFSGM